MMNFMTVPLFGMPGGSPEYCKEHKLEGMISDKTCFGFKGGNMEYCNYHKQEGMINLRTKKCAFTDCMVQARFALPGQQAQYCSEHKFHGMINVILLTKTEGNLNSPAIKDATFLIVNIDLHIIYYFRPVNFIAKLMHL